MQDARCSLVRRLGAMVVLIALIAGCSGDGKPDSPSDAGQSSALESPSPEVVAVLVKADAADGAADKVIGKCVTCSLAMAGSAENAVTVGEYTVHLCSPECKEHFEGEPAKALMALKIPDAPEPTK